MDHLEDGSYGEKYNVGGRNERQNMRSFDGSANLWTRFSPNPYDGGHEKLITYVTDRPGHDARYAIDADKLESELGWKARGKLR